ERFGEGLDKPNNWLDNDMKTICAGAGTPLDKARKIYAYVRDNITCTDHEAFYLTSTLKQVFTKRNGNVVDVNLLLVAMLRHEGMEADPVLLSTRDNGFTYESYPILERFNYVICRLKIDDKKYCLDASHDYLGFNRLPEECYNGHSRVVNAKMPEIVYLWADSLREKKATSVFIAASDSDKTKMEGTFQSKLGYFESTSVRNSIKAKGKEAFFKKVKAGYNLDIEIKNPVVDSIPQKDEPLTESYTFTFDKPADGMLYINPMMGEGTKENFFKSAERHYPVEMPYAVDEVYVFNLEVPEGYEVEELPKSARVSLNETDGMFEYLVDKAEGHIRLMSHIKLNKATFLPEEYDSLRQWFGYIVKKHAEQVVLKKK
ncbi:MAG TPA: transglutaminase domain-containing protein, partial [Chitinophagaceae bacterium]|nr:transglutaminase domain-containing protein [Chitinophagaceae bacterium]